MLSTNYRVGLRRFAAFAAVIALSVVGLLRSGAAQEITSIRYDLASCPQNITDPTDELRIFALTMSPGGDLFSRFGHNGVWVSSPRGQSIVYNFGVISLNHPNLVQGFLTGELDYLLGHRSFDSMRELYTESDRTVVVQELSLPPEVPRTLLNFLVHEARPENRDYRYHWFDANCATRVRDKLDELLSGQFSAQHQTLSGTTQRDQVLRHLASDLLVWLGWHIAVGGSADEELTRWETFFLPDNLFDGLADTTVEWPDGNLRPLVSSACELYEGGNHWAPASPPNRDLLLWAIGLAIGLLFALIGRLALRSVAARLVFGLLLLVFGAVAGAVGAASSYLWLSSSLVGFWQNANLWVVNPLALLLVPLALLVIAGWGKGIRLSARLATLLAAFGVIGLISACLPILPQNHIGPVGLFLPALLSVANSLRRLAKLGSTDTLHNKTKKS